VDFSYVIHYSEYIEASKEILESADKINELCSTILEVMKIFIKLGGNPARISDNISKLTKTAYINNLIENTIENEGIINVFKDKNCKSSIIIEKSKDISTKMKSNYYINTVSLENICVNLVDIDISRFS
jgi:hypothetical protein